MDAQTIGLILTTMTTVIASLAAAFTTVRKSELDALNRTVKAHEQRIADLETDLKAEREAHKVTREEREAAYAELNKLRFKVVPSQ